MINLLRLTSVNWLVDMLVYFLTTCIKIITLIIIQNVMAIIVLCMDQVTYRIPVNADTVYVIPGLHGPNIVKSIPVQRPPVRTQWNLNMLAVLLVQVRIKGDNLWIIVIMLLLTNWLVGLITSYSISMLT